MKKLWLVAAIPGMIAVAAVAVVVSLFIVKFLWAWTVPDLFPGAVKLGLIARNITWLTAFKVALLFGLLAGLKGPKCDGKS
jgi:hypothetical protein